MNKRKLANKRIVNFIIYLCICVGIFSFFIADCTSYDNQYCRNEIARLYKEVDTSYEASDIKIVPTSFLKDRMISLLALQLAGTTYEIICAGIEAEDESDIELTLSNMIDSMVIATDNICSYQGTNASLVEYSSFNCREVFKNYVKTKDDSLFSNLTSQMHDFKYQAAVEMVTDCLVGLVFVVSFAGVILNAIKIIKYRGKEDNANEVCD